MIFLHSEQTVLHLANGFVYERLYTYAFWPLILREKGRDLTQSYDKTPYTHRIKKTKKKQRDNIKRYQKFRFQNNCGPTKDGQLE